jgi:vacuolar protein sorting-associated protein 45
VASGHVVADPQQHLPRLVVVFVVGGTTFEEAAAVAEINAAAARGEGPAGATGARVLLGGTGVLNSSAFLRTIEALAASEQQQHAGMYQQQQRARGGGY